MFGKRLTLFQLFGFSVRADLSWLLIAALVAWSLSTSFFPEYYQNLTPAAYWVMGVTGAVGLFASITFHEFCHSLVARRFGLAMRGITLFLFGGIAEMSEEPRHPKVEFLMAAAGPVASVVLGVACLGLHHLSRWLGWPSPVQGVTGYLAMINFVLAVFNLLPAFPLDGGRMLRAALWRLKGDLKWATKVATTAGMAFGVGLIVLGVMYIMAGQAVGGIWYFIIGLFLKTSAQESNKQVLIREALADKRVRDLMTPDPVVVKPGIPLRTLADDFIHRHQYKLFPVVNGGHLLGCASLARLREVAPQDWDRTTAGDIVDACSADNVVAPDTEAFTALTAMNRSGLGRAMVVDNGRLVGIISRHDIYNYLTYHSDVDVFDDEE